MEILKGAYKKLKKIIVFSVFGTLICSNVYAAEYIRLQEQKIKAGLVYNFIKYSYWPQEAFLKTNEPFQVCLFGGDAFDGALDPLQGRTAQKRSINIKEIDDLSALHDCHMVYIHEDEADDIGSILKAVQSQYILTISDIKNFSKRGGMVELSRSPNNRILLRINSKAINASGLHVGEQLLKLAETS